jgi:hypothetical protein
MDYVSNAFSLNMLENKCARIDTHNLFDREAAAYCKNAYSVVGHESTAAVISNTLGVDVPFRRESLVLYPEDRLLVAQYLGPRLEEGATVLPEGASLQFVILVYEENGPVDRIKDLIIED